MAYDGWIEFGGVELVNLSRTAQLAEALGISTVWTNPEQVQWIEDNLEGTGYDNITEAPWYDPAYPASAEFAGLVPLAFAGLGDNTLTSSVVEYVTDGGSAGKARNATKAIVANGALVATTDRGVEYGRRWMDKVLAGPGPTGTCSGTSLRYFRYVGDSLLGWESVDVINGRATDGETAWGEPSDINPDTAPGGGPAATAIHAQVNTGFARAFFHEPISVGPAPKTVRASVWVYATGAGDSLNVEFRRSNEDGTDDEAIGSPVVVAAETGWQLVQSGEFETSEDYPYVYVTFTLEATASNAESWVTELVVEKYVLANPSPIAHHRNVKVTRGSSITRRTRRDCSVTWMTTFTLTAADPFEYGEPEASIEGLGGTVSGPGLISDGDIVLLQEGCPVYDYTPIYDPLYPALVPSPTAPDFYPAGWGIVDGETFQRFWAIVDPIEPAGLPVVPIITLTTPEDARTVRVSIWTGDTLTSDQCDPLFSTVVSYIPAGTDFIIDGEQQVSYTWDGVAPLVRRADSLVYSPDARPVDWDSFSTEGGLLVTLDLFSDSDAPAAAVEMALSFVSKSG